MYQNLAAALAAFCIVAPVFSQTASPAVPVNEPLKAGFICVA